MKPVVVLILLIAIVLVLYSVVLGVDLGSKGEGKPKSIDSAGAGWVDAMSGLTAWFAPALELPDALCNGQRVSGLFRLTESAPNCSFAIPRDPEKNTYRHAELRVIATSGAKPPTVYVRAVFDEDDFAKNDRDPDTCILTDPEERLDPYRLELEYDPAGDGPDDWSCWLLQKPSKPASLTVLEDGGTLTLTCVGCDTSERREVTLRLK